MERKPDAIEDLKFACKLNYLLQQLDLYSVHASTDLGRVDNILTHYNCVYSL